MIKMLLNTKGVLLFFFISGINAFSIYGSTQPKAEEYKVKAVFVYNFTQFVEWNNPVDTNNFIIGVLGKSDIIKPLQEISKNKLVGNKKIKVVVFDRPGDISMCHILFIPGATSMSDIKLSIEERENILIIAEAKNIKTGDADMNLIVVEDKIKFEINQKALEKKGLKFSSQLLKMAIIVQ